MRIQNDHKECLIILSFCLKEMNKTNNDESNKLPAANTPYHRVISKGCYVCLLQRDVS